MKYLLQENDNVERIFVSYGNIKDITTFRLDLFVRNGYEEVKIPLKNTLNEFREIVLLPGFLKAYRRLKSKLKDGTPIKIYLEGFEKNLDDESRLLLEVADECK